MGTIKHKVLSGADVFLNQYTSYKNYRIGLVTNNAALTNNKDLSRVAFLQAGFKILKLFSPEHGLNTKGADGARQQNITDEITGLPVISLYSESFFPSAEDISNLDMLVFDIPDAGSRFYTYLWTLTYIMEACAVNKIPLIILDRPNPLGGDLSKTEGPMLDERHCSSFIGRWSIPIRHSCTYGELAKYFSETRHINVQLKIITVEAWERKSGAGKDWKFIPTSPAITDIETALLYPGMGLMEGVNVNEGRGTNYPFRVLGAPWIDSGKLFKAFTDLKLPGIKAGKTVYTPCESLYQNEVCYGLKLKITDKEVFRPVLTGLNLIALLQSLFPGKCEERLYKTFANPSGKNHLDKLTGAFNSFAKIKVDRLDSEYTCFEKWKDTISPYLLY